MTIPLSQRPLQATRADATLFVDREAELDKLDRSIDRGFNTLVLGDRGAGVTSLLRRFELALEERSIPWRHVEAGAASTADELLLAIDEAVHDRRRAPGEWVAVSDLATGPGVPTGWAALPRLVIVVDSVPHPAAVQHVFGRLRDDVWQLPFTWVVAGRGTDRRRYLEPPADSFFDVVIDVGELTAADAGELLRRRAAQDPHDPAAKIVDALAGPLAARVVPRTPRSLLAAAREALLSGDDAEHWLAGFGDVQARAAALGRPAATLFAEVMDLAPVSASDDRLLDRLGWTRARATQVFKDLEDAGLVTASDAAPEGPGRPRKLYSPATPTHGGER